MSKDNTDTSPQARIIAAARTLFFKHGVSAVTTDMLVAEAKTSKMTLYKYFPNKSDILKAFLEKECERLYDVNLPLPETEKEWKKSLLQFGVNLLELLSDPDILRFDQLMLSQAAKHPELTQVYYKASYQASCDALKALIAHGQKRKWVKVKEDPEFLAFILCVGWEGKTYHKALYGLEQPNFGDKKKRTKHLLHFVLGSTF